MFSAGLEIDVDQFRKAQTRAIGFGVATTMAPQLLGTLYGLAFGYSLIPAIVVGSLLASHTLLALSIVMRLGVMSFEPIVVAIGATVVSDTLSLIVFAICFSTYTAGFSLSGIAIQILEIIVFVPLILIGLSRAGAYVLSRFRHNEEAFFVVMLGIMAIAGTIADLINLPGIVGAFLAGLAVNAAAHDHPAKAKLEFLGKALFIPSFFIVTGFLIDPLEFVRSTVQNFPLVAGIIAALLVAYETRNAAGQRLLDTTMLNAVLVLMLVTSILGPGNLSLRRLSPAPLFWACRQPQQGTGDAFWA